VDHEKLMALLGKQIADSGVLKLIQQMLKAGYEAKGQRFETADSDLFRPGFPT